MKITKIPVSDLKLVKIDIFIFLTYVLFPLRNKYVLIAVDNIYPSSCRLQFEVYRVYRK
jgi:hypothetical protein